MFFPGADRRGRRGGRRRGRSRSLPRGGDLRPGPGENDRCGAGVDPRGVPEGEHHDHRECQGEGDACRGDRTSSGRRPRQAFPTRGEVEEEPVPADQEELIEELQTLRAGQQPAPEARPQPTSMAVLDQVRPTVGEAVPTLLQAIGEPVDPPLAPSLEPRGAPLPAGGRARSRPPSNGGSRRQGEEFFRNVHVRGLSTPSLVQTRARAGQISSLQEEHSTDGVGRTTHTALG